MRRSKHHVLLVISLNMSSSRSLSEKSTFRKRILMAAKKSPTKILPPLNPQETFREVEWVVLAYLLPNVKKRVKETPIFFFFFQKWIFSSFDSQRFVRHCLRLKAAAMSKMDHLVIWAYSARRGRAETVTEDFD